MNTTTTTINALAALDWERIAKVSAAALHGEGAGLETIVDAQRFIKSAPTLLRSLVGIAESERHAVTIQADAGIAARRMLGFSAEAARAAVYAATGVSLERPPSQPYATGPGVANLGANPLADEAAARQGTAQEFAVTVTARQAFWDAALLTSMGAMINKMPVRESDGTEAGELALKKLRRAIIAGANAYADDALMRRDACVNELERAVRNVETGGAP